MTLAKRTQRRFIYLRRHCDQKHGQWWTRNDNSLRRSQWYLQRIVWRLCDKSHSFASTTALSLSITNHAFDYSISTDRWPLFKTLCTFTIHYQPFAQDKKKHRRGESFHECWLQLWIKIIKMQWSNKLPELINYLKDCGRLSATMFNKTFTYRLRVTNPTLS